MNGTKRFKDGERRVTEATLVLFGEVYKVKIRKEQYGANGATALTATEVGTGEPCATVSVNITEGCALTSDKLPKDHCYVKTWSENEGILGQLVEQRILQTLGVYHQGTGAPVCKILF